MNDKPISIKKTWREGDPLILIDFLEKYTSFSKSLLKKILNNGGVWVRLYNDSRLTKIRRATAELTNSSHVECYYDPKLYNLEISTAVEMTQFKEWGIWHKPAGLLSQGTFYGDHCSILRQVEKSKGKAWLIHRLDREASGLMIFAYSPKAAKLFSGMFQNHEVKKFYQVEVIGLIDKGGVINQKLDGKDAKTTYEVLKKFENTTRLKVEIHTGRLHQIRRHFDFIGHPVVGDPKYGRGNKNSEGLKLIANQLIFIDPLTKKEINFILPDNIETL